MEVGSAPAVWLPDRVVWDILERLTPAELSKVSCVSLTLRDVAAEIASRDLLAVLTRLHCFPLPQMMKGRSRIAALHMWGSVESHTVTWLRASASLVERDAAGRVVCWDDLSGRGNQAFAEEVEARPCFKAHEFGNGRPCLEFGGRAQLVTKAFGPRPLPQPVTILLVGRSRGDNTFVDSLSSASGRFELCHGYPNAGGEPDAPAICMTAHGSSRRAPSQLLRGTTRSEGKWHVYTAVFDGERSALFVDGVREASGKAVGEGTLNGLRLGCDAAGKFFLRGAIAECRVFDCVLGSETRGQLETVLAVRYGLTLRDPEVEAKVPLFSRMRCLSW